MHSRTLLAEIWRAKPYGYEKCGRLRVTLTAGIALANVAKEERAKVYRPLVYIASPFAGDTEHNIERTHGYCRFAI